MHKSITITDGDNTFHLQAAKEFETELKKDGEPSPSAEPSNVKITAVSEEEKQEDKVPSTNGNS